MLVKVKKLDGEKEDYNFEDSDTILSVRLLRTLSSAYLASLTVALSTYSLCLNFSFAAPRQVKAAISERVGVPPEQLRLIHQGSPLRDEDTLQQARVTAGSTIHVISQLRGGY
jgi:hypothetical protein